MFSGGPAAGDCVSGGHSSGAKKDLKRGEPDEVLGV